MIQGVRYNSTKSRLSYFVISIAVDTSGHALLLYSGIFYDEI